MARSFFARQVARARHVAAERDTLYAEGARVALRCQGAARVLEDARRGLAVEPVRKPGNCYKLARFAVSGRRSAA